MSFDEIKTEINVDVLDKMTEDHSKKLIEKLNCTDTSYELFLAEIDKNQIYIQEALKMVSQIKAKHPSLVNLKEEEILAIYIYYSSFKDKTGRVVCSQINNILRVCELNEIEGYIVFISILCNTIFKLSNEWCTVYGVLKLTDEELEEYKQGDIIMWKEFLSCSLDRKIANAFSKINYSSQSLINKKTVILRINLARVALIDNLCQFSNEKEVLFPAFTYFEIKYIDINSSKTITEIELTQIGSAIEVGNNNEKKILIWVDNNHENNQNIQNRLDYNIVQLKTLSSTVGAINYINEDTNVLSNNLNRLRIITSMVRDENGVKNYEAGLDLIKHLRSIKYDVLIFLYCSKNTKKIFLEKKTDIIINYGQICIENSEAQCLKFASFKNMS